MIQRWVITGANGYLGGQLCKGLCAKGDNVVGIARPGRSLKHLEACGVVCHTYEDLPAVLSNGDIFIHCAGKVGNLGSLDEFIMVNRDWSLALFDMAADHGVRCFVYMSSVAIFGYKNRVGNGILTEAFVSENVKGEFYGRSKLAAEQALNKRAQSKETGLLIFRPGLIYGHRSFAAKQTWLKRGIVIDSNQCIPLIHMDNLTEAVKAVAVNDKINGVYLAVDKEQPTIDELNNLKIRYGLLTYSPWHIGRIGFWGLWFCRVLFRLLRGRYDRGSLSSAVAEYYFHTRKLSYDTSKFKSDFGIEQKVSLEKGLAECGNKND